MEIAAPGERSGSGVEASGGRRSDSALQAESKAAKAIGKIREAAKEKSKVRPIAPVVFRIRPFNTHTIPSHHKHITKSISSVLLPSATL
ncbi:hypothetical protein [Hydrogenibacillus schlegelii]|uniref:hypothetical protein n=1 Tax=Hydrogenibacillus schlegelii TaxID=1484 RepID=UPI00147093AA|nr:hypothetical protein [Hydrogenibacillus schlegelii]